MERYIQMNVAILLCGQMRQYNDPDVIESLRVYLGQFASVDIYVSTWSDRGVSYNHGHVCLQGDEGEQVTEATLRQYFPQIHSIRIHDTKVWEKGLQGAWKAAYTEGFTWSGMKIRGTVIPQLFTLWDANQLRKESGIKHDLVIRCRPDALFAGHAPSIYHFVSPNTIYAINNPSTGTFYPQRIYDIFFFGTAEAMDGVCGAYKNFNELEAYPWQNGLHPRDACRCLYIQARFFVNIAVVDLPIDICVIKR
jgi:hypothetical protein